MLSLDLRVYHAIQEVDPSTLYGVAHALDLGARALLGLLIVAGCIAQRRLDARQSLGEFTLLVASGGVLCELLKTAIERLRPSALPEFSTGNSLPSGHIMNTTLFAVVAWHLATALPLPWRRTIRAIAIVSVAMQCAARVMHRSHWPSDLAPSVLLALAWMLGARALWRVHGLPTALVVGCIAAYGAFWVQPSIRWHVASVLDRPRITLTTWQPDADTTQVGRATLRSDQETPTTIEAILRIACDAPGPCSCRVRVSANGWTSREIGLEGGWRWYPVRPDPHFLRIGANEIAITPDAACATSSRQRVAVRSIALVADPLPPPYRRAANDTDAVAAGTTSRELFARPTGSAPVTARR